MPIDRQTNLFGFHRLVLDRSSPMINEVPQKGLMRDRQPAGRTGQETSVGHNTRLLTGTTGRCPKHTEGTFPRRHS